MCAFFTSCVSPKTIAYDGYLLLPISRAVFHKPAPKESRGCDMNIAARFTKCPWLVDALNNVLPAGVNPILVLFIKAYVTRTIGYDSVSSSGGYITSCLWLICP